MQSNWNRDRTVAMSNIGFYEYSKLLKMNGQDHCELHSSSYLDYNIEELFLKINFETALLLQEQFEQIDALQANTVVPGSQVTVESQRRCPNTCLSWNETQLITINHTL